MLTHSKRADSMTRRIFAVCFGMTVIAMGYGCGSGDKPASVDVKGTVTFDGKPIPDGEIILTSPGQGPTIFPIKDGAFSGKALSGTNKVEVFAYKPGPPMTTDPEKKPTKINYLPDTYGPNTKLTADVKAGGSNDFKFDLTSR